MPRDLHDQVIVITGASSGIGAATAVACARAGMHVVLNARRAERLEQLAAQIHALGRQAELVVGDVREPGMSPRLLDAAEQRFGRFDVVFANAGYGFRKAVHELEEAELREIFDVNFFAAWDLLKHAARRLIAAHRPGHLLMCSSCVAKFTLPGSAAYTATKAAQNHFCRAMRMELREVGIEVASVHPIATRTEFFDQAAQRSGLARPRPQRFMQPPEQVARAIVQCLRRPRPEVWTSSAMRIVAGLMTMFPPLMDWVARRRGL